MKSWAGQLQPLGRASSCRSTWVVPLPWVWPVPLPAEALAFGAAGRFGAAACGVAAPNAKLRALVVPQGPPEQDEPASEDAAAAECEVESLQTRPNRMSWARLLKRVLGMR